MRRPQRSGQHVRYVRSKSQKSKSSSYDNNGLRELSEYLTLDKNQQSSYLMNMKEKHGSDEMVPVKAKKSPEELLRVKQKNLDDRELVKKKTSCSAEILIPQARIQRSLTNDKGNIITPLARSQPSPTIPKKSEEQESKKPSKCIDRMKEGDLVKSERFTWKIVKLLGAGGFGNVYKVRRENDDDDMKKYAMKTEMIEGERKMLRLKVEVTVLRQCWAQKDPAVRKHFVEYIDRGITNKFKFFVMGLVGPSLEDIRRQYLTEDYTKSTVFNISLQTLRAIANLHTVGWIHRDVKPSNYAVGLGDKEDTIFILDFGIARSIFEPGTKVIKIPRIKVKFMGTLRFAARACHHGLEQGRKDDLESWIYMVFYLFDTYNGIPWKKLSDRVEVINAKEKFFNHGYKRCYKIVPTQFKKLVDYVNKLTYSDAPDYKYVENTMAAIANSNNIKLNDPLDWLGKIAERKTVEEKEEKCANTDSEREREREEEVPDEENSDEQLKENHDQHVKPGTTNCHQKNFNDNTNTKNRCAPKAKFQSCEDLNDPP